MKFTNKIKKLKWVKSHAVEIPIGTTYIVTYDIDGSPDLRTKRWNIRMRESDIPMSDGYWRAILELKD